MYPSPTPTRETFELWYELGELYARARENSAYHVFPREMTMPLEFATRGAYLTISCKLLWERYSKELSIPEDLRRRAQKDLREHRALVRR